MERRGWWVCGCGLAFVLLAGGLSVAHLTLRLLRDVAPRKMGRPAELETVGTRVAAPFLAIRSVALPAGVGPVQALAWGRLDGGPEPELAVVGAAQVVYLTATDRVQRTVTVGGTGRQGPLQVVDLDADGQAEILSGGTWSAATKVSDHAGKLLWSAPGPSGVNAVAAADVDGDRRREIAIGYNGGGGVELYDRAGKRLWHVPGSNVWQVQAVDANGDGRDELLHSNAGGELTLLDATGAALRSFRVTSGGKPAYVSHFQLLRDPSQATPPRLLVPHEGRVRLADLTGKELRSWAFPGAGRLTDTQAVAVRWQAGQPAHVAILSCGKLHNRGTLAIFDPTGKLVHQEVFEARSAALCTVPNGQAEVLLLGVGTKLLRYRYRAPAPTSAPAPAANAP